MAKLEKATLAGGCFWCMEAIFKRLRGVKKVVSGYSGGQMKNPDYEKVASGITGHAESIQITFNPSVISYERLLEVFFRLHDPTTLNRQGSDVGAQYRSTIFYHNIKQRRVAEKVTAKIEKSGLYQRPIVTEIVPFEDFYEAEEEHQNFYERNRAYPYCQIVIDPKIRKLYENFGEIVKKQP